jgi:hypothetical protein
MDKPRGQFSLFNLFRVSGQCLRYNLMGTAVRPKWAAMFATSKLKAKTGETLR